MREEVAELSPLSVRTVTPAAAYESRVFNGYAQGIVQSLAGLEVLCCEPQETTSN